MRPFPGRETRALCEMFHRYIDVESIPPKGKTIKIEADDAERAELATRFELVSVEVFFAEILVRPLPKGKFFILEGKYEAKIVQNCVISLQPFESSVKGSISRRFGSAPPIEEDVEVLIELDEEDPPEPLDEGRIDVAEAIAEEFGVNLEPFPRSPGSDFEGYQVGNENEKVEKAGPFAALAALKEKMKE